MLHRFLGDRVTACVDAPHGCGELVQAEPSDQSDCASGEPCIFSFDELSENSDEAEGGSVDQPLSRGRHILGSRGLQEGKNLVLVGLGK